MRDRLNGGALGLWDHFDTVYRRVSGWRRRRRRRRWLVVIEMVVWLR